MGKAMSPWIKHVMATRKKNPGLSLKAAMKKASASWKKKK